jgi:hypothetical protein
MAKFMGRLGAIYAPTGATDLSNVSLAQVGSSNEYVIADAAVRIVRAFAESASPSDFTLSSGSIVGLKRPVGAVVVSGGTAPYSLTSANLKVSTLAPVGGFLDWTLHLREDILDTTTLGAEYREHRRLLRDWEAAAERFWIDENFTLDVAPAMKALDEEPFVVSFFVNTESANYYRYAGFALVEGLQVSASVRGVVAESLRFRGHDTLHFRRASD